MQAWGRNALVAAVLLIGVPAAVIAFGMGLRDDGGSGRSSQRAYAVEHVIDGDTIRLRDGRTVRLVGIDAPEREECGYGEAGAALAGLVLREQVRLTVSDEDTDQYGRLLRYVDVGEVDAGLRLIERGLASARYDSRDGYGRHPREHSYVVADGAARDFSCAP